MFECIAQAQPPQSPGYGCTGNRKRIATGSFLWIFRENLCQAHTYAGVFAFSQSLIFFMYAVAFWTGSIFVDNHNMQPTDVYRVFFAFMFCGQMVGNISSFIPDVVKARCAASLLFYLIEHPSEIDNLSEDGVRKVGRSSVLNSSCYVSS
ncbi:hypothetical protein COOONC_24613 [Cooperia oncophora]